MPASLTLNACVSPQAGQVRRKVNSRSWLRVSGSVSIPASIAVPVAGQRKVKSPIVSPRESTPEGGITFSKIASHLDFQAYGGNFSTRCRTERDNALPENRRSVAAARQGN